MASKALSIYVHWPFCQSLCPYCDFNSHLLQSYNLAEWQAAYLQEIKSYRQIISGSKIKTIFFGGGSPSLMPPSLVGAIIDSFADDLVGDAEITIEANPSSSEMVNFLGYSQAGVNRISLGVQSFDDNILRYLGRKHSASEAIAAIELAAKYYSNYSFDLIYAIEGQSLNDWQRQLARAVELSASHLSLYQLTIERGTQFFDSYQKGQLKLPSSELAADMYTHTLNYLAKHNFNRYEISNYAKIGFECKHNIAYWQYDDYLGIGPGAHSRLHDGNSYKAIMNYNNPKRWFEAVQNNAHARQQDKKLSNTESAIELAMMQTRLKDGIAEQNLRQKTSLYLRDIFDEDVLVSYQQEGVLHCSAGRVCIDAQHMQMQNYILSRLLKI